jgi:DNA helicase HerA-like ATPase
LLDWNSIGLTQIGIVASPARETEAMCILHEGEEKRVTTETLVLIDNRNGNKILAVCRRGTGANDALKTDYYNPGIAYAKRGKGPSTAKEFYGFNLVVIGDVTDGEIKQNKIIIAPASPVYTFPDDFNPMKLLSKSSHTLGYYATGSPLWKVPLLTEYISHHIGVFGITGSGKSYLTRYQIIPLLRNAGYDVMIFDWKGSDYAPYYKDVVNMGDIQLDEQSVYSYLAEKLKGFGGGNTGDTLLGYLEEVVSEGAWRGKTLEETRRRIYDRLCEIIKSDNRDNKGAVNQWGQRYLRRAEAYFKQLDADDFKPIAGTKTPEELYSMLKEKHLLTIDLSLGSKEQKLTIFLSIIRYLKKLMEAKTELNVALVIDEAPQYCPWQYRGIEEETTREIIGSAALGRSYKLSLVLISQGIAGEIGINAAVRRNLNTLFVGRIHPLDAQEAEKFFATAAVDPSSLLRLPEGQFYVIGKMNPSPVPLLITFEIPEDEKVGGRK